DKTQAFILYDNEKKAGEMTVSIHGIELTAEHTEVAPFYRGRGFAVKLVEGMADYVRSHGMKVGVLYPYTYAQFNRHPENMRTSGIKANGRFIDQLLKYCSSITLPSF